MRMAKTKVHEADALKPKGPAIEVVDMEWKPVEGLKYKVKIAGGSTKEGTTASDGTIPLDSKGEVELGLAGEAEGGSGAETEKDKRAGGKKKPSV